jgi:hypothetical protein
MLHTVLEFIGSEKFVGFNVKEEQLRMLLSLNANCYNIKCWGWSKGSDREVFGNFFLHYD